MRVPDGTARIEGARWPLAAILAALVFGGCATMQAPHDWLTPPGQAAGDVYGGWAILTVDGADSVRVVRGELLAAGGDALVVLSDGATVACPLHRVRDARLERWRQDMGGAQVVTWCGILSTPSHGVLMIGTLPLWILGGSLSTAAMSREPILSYPSSDARTAAEFASLAAPWSRFPAGMPAGLDSLPLATKWVAPAAHR